jgi:hypothetical protein
MRYVFDTRDPLFCISVKAFHRTQISFGLCRCSSNYVYKSSYKESKKYVYVKHICLVNKQKLKVEQTNQLTTDQWRTLTYLYMIQHSVENALPILALFSFRTIRGTSSLRGIKWNSIPCMYWSNIASRRTYKIIIFLSK